MAKIKWTSTKAGWSWVACKIPEGLDSLSLCDMVCKAGLLASQSFSRTSKSCFLYCNNLCNLRSRVFFDMSVNDVGAVLKVNQFEKLHGNMLSVSGLGFRTYPLSNHI